MANRLNFTQATLDALPVPEKRTWVYDTKVLQLGLTLLPSGTRSFHVRSTVHGQTKRIALENGKYPGMKVEQARREANRLLSLIADKADPVEARKQLRASEITLREVFTDYFTKKRDRYGNKLRPATQREYEMALEATVDDYWDRPLSDLNNENLILRAYRKRMDESKSRAKAFHKVITALFNFARVNYKRPTGESYFPDNPGQIIVDQRLLITIPRRKTYIREEELADWFDAVESLDTVEREFLLFILMTGVRKNEAMTLTWEAVDLRTGTFTLTDTKNREDVELPVPFYLLPMLKKRKGKGRIFPVDRDAKSCLRKVRQGAGVHFTLHDLRRTYATTAEDLDISGLTVKRLLNHKADGNVTSGYQIPNLKRLRSVSDRIVREMLKRSGRLNADVVELRA